MPETRRTPRKAPTTAPGPSRVVKRTVSTTSTGLANDLNRVLKISQPDPQPVASSSTHPTPTVASKAAPKPFRLVTAPSKPAPTAARAPTVPLPTASGSKPRLPRLVEPKTPAPSTAAKRLPSRAIKTAGDVPAPRPVLGRTEKGKAKQVDDLPEWAKPDSGLAPPQMAAEAMNLLNMSFRSLKTAIREGYQHSSSPVKSTSASDPSRRQDPAGWSDAKVESLVADAEVAIRLLRDLEAGGGLQEGTAWKRALQVLLLARPYLLRLYEHSPDRVPALPALPPHTPPLVKPRGSSSVLPRPSTSRPAPATATSRLKPNTKDAALPTSISVAEKALLRYPLPTGGLDGIADPVRILLFQAISDATACLATIYHDLDDIAELLCLDPERFKSTMDTIPLVGIATSIPQSTTISPLHTVYRQLSALATRTPVTIAHRLSLDIRLAALTFLAISVDPTEEANLSPNYVWDSAHRAAVTWYSNCETVDETERLRKIFESVQSLVGNVRDACRRREQAFALWRDNPGWSKLIDFVEAVARKLQDPVVTSWASAQALTTQDLVIPRSVAESVPEVNMTESAVEDILRTVTEAFWNASSVLSDCSAHPSRIETAIQTLQGLRFSDLHHALRTTFSSPDLTEAFSRLERRILRVVNLSEKLLDHECGTTTSSTISASGEALRDWIEGYLSFALDVFRAASTAPACGPMAAGMGSRVAHCIGKLSDYAPRLHSSPSKAEAARVSVLELGLEFCRLASIHSISSLATRAEWTRELSKCARKFAFDAYHARDYALAERFARLSLDLDALALEALSSDPSIAEGDRCWQEYRQLETKAHECLAASFANLGRIDEAMEAIVRAVAALADDIVKSLVESSADRPVSAVLQVPGLGIVNSHLNRLRAYIANSAAIFQDSATLNDLTGALSARISDPAAVGVICEGLVAVLSRHEHRPEVAGISLAILRQVANLYKLAKMPVRELRVVAHRMCLMQQSGLHADDWAAVAERFEVLASTSKERLGPDSALGSHIAEHVALGRAALVFQAYFAHDPLSTSIDRCVAALQGLVITPGSTPRRSPVKALRRKTAAVPPPRVSPTKMPTRTPRTPARGSKVMLSSAAAAGAAATAPKKKALSPLTPKSKSGGIKTSTAEQQKPIHEVARLAKVSGSLVGLLGMLSHTLAKVDILKVLRALLRGKEEYVDDYVRYSTELATEYHKLGKNSRANYVYSQAEKLCLEGSKMVSIDSRVHLHLRYAAFLARTGKLAEARTEYVEAFLLSEDIEPDKNSTNTAAILLHAALLERSALAHTVFACLAQADDRAHDATWSLTSAFRLRNRVASNVCRLCPDQRESGTSASSQSDSGRVKDVFDAPTPRADDSSDKDNSEAHKSTSTEKSEFARRRLGGYQWQVGELLIESAFAAAQATAARGSVGDAEYFLNQARIIGHAVHAPVILARYAARMSELKSRLAQLEQSEERLDEAANRLVDHDGPEMVEVKKQRGDLLVKQGRSDQAEAIWSGVMQELEGLDALFGEKDSILVSPQRLVKSMSNLSISKAAEPLLPTILGHVLRQKAWLLREEGKLKASEALMAQVVNLGDAAEEHYLNGRIWLQDAFEIFKSDLFMSSLTESTISIPMGASDVKSKSRLSTRHKIEVVLDRAGGAFLQALKIAASSGKVEDVRRACLNVALLKAFQTCLGQGGRDNMAMAANLMASSAAITLHRELLEAIIYKLSETSPDDLPWPAVSSEAVTEEVPQPRASKPIRSKHGSPLPVRRPPVSLTGPRERVISTASAFSAWSADSDSPEIPLRAFWAKVRAQHASTSFLTDEPDLSVMPEEWAVVSISVSEDRKTMFVSRHQRDKQPLLFCLPLDRQARREGEDDEDTYSLEMAKEELDDIIHTCRETATEARHITDPEGKAEWWDRRHALDKRLEELCANMENCWMGAFKAILKPRPRLTPKSLSNFGGKLDRIFSSALSDGGHEVKRGRVKLDDALLENFLTLGSRCQDEEIEDLVYFILDIYQFHGVPVALAELDLDQLGIDVKSALADAESQLPAANSTHASDNDYLFLALDRNVASFPWESIPCLRGKSVSRIPSLSFLLNQLSMGAHLPPVNGFTAGPLERRRINSRKTYYILNPAKDLNRTEEHFKPWIKEMVERAGWQGVIGRHPTELELKNALKEYDLVIYFGHGGAEHYIRSHMIRHLPRCATVMLWGCSSGSLREQGDLDRNGTAWHYMVGGCPSLTATLWDVTDKDIDRLSNEVLRKLHLDTSHVPDKKSSRNLFGKSQPVLTHRNAAALPLSDLSTVQAVNRSRDECKMRYLTGAAVVTYGIPVWLH